MHALGAEDQIGEGQGEETADLVARPVVANVAVAKIGSGSVHRDTCVCRRQVKPL